MNANSPLETYLAAFKAYGEIQDCWDDPGWAQSVRAQLSVLEKSFRDLLNVAESTDPAIWHAIGTGFRSGLGTKRDRAEAIRWFQRAAEAGHAPAMLSLGSCLQRPEPSIDPAGAIQWFCKAAESGHAPAMVSLGFTYRDGTGVPSDYTEALRWFMKAVAAGDSHSMTHVGRVYAHYLSSPKEAVTWFLRAAQAVQGDSFLELARLYDNRDLDVYNPAEAHKWFRVAAEHSEGRSTNALFAIARQYIEGVGAQCDLEMAKWWLNRILLVAPEKSASRRQASQMLKKIESQFL